MYWGRRKKNISCGPVRKGGGGLKVEKMQNVLNIKICIWKDFKLFRMFSLKIIRLDHSESIKKLFKKKRFLPFLLFLRLSLFFFLYIDLSFTFLRERIKITKPCISLLLLLLLVINEPRGSIHNDLKKIKAITREAEKFVNI